MNLVKCSKGHFYDGDKFASCPHCGGGMPSDSVTVSLPSGDSSEVTVAMPASSAQESVTVSQYAPSEPVTQQSTAPEPVSFADAMSKVQSFAPAEDDDNRTVSYYSQKIAQPVNKEPVVGWLVCTAGKYFGQSFTLKSGRNFVGRSASMDVCLDGENSVSRDRHAVIIYEPRERMFIAQPGESRELFYVNDDVVLDNVVLKPYDRISLGKVNLMIIPCCTKEFAWEDLAESEK
ncbi:MAG: FHA domain-containing protein [Lachnospiraceae bacterium]|nr:FHA domain-containing protein [Lachnospiraceae bacterium]